MRHIPFLFTISLLILPFIGLSQSHLWSNAVGGVNIDHARGVCIADDGSVVTVGEFNNTVDLDPGPGVFPVTANGSADAYVRKLDANGDFLWAGTLGGTGVDQAFDVALDAAGNIHVVGCFAGTADLDIGSGVQSATSVNTADDVFVLKLDPNGSTIWARWFGGPSNDAGHGVAVDGQGRVHVAGVYANTMDIDPGAGIANVSSNGMEDAFVLCLDAAGDHQWGYGFGGTQDDAAWGVAADAAGNSTITGEFKGTVDLDPTVGTSNSTSNGAEDAFVVRLDNTGAFAWAVGMGGTGFERAVGVAMDGVGACVITGDMDSPTDIDPGTGTVVLPGSSFEDAYVLKLDAAGAFEWGFLLEGFLNDGLGAAIDVVGNVYVCGEYNGTTDMDPGPGVANLTTVPGPNGYVASYLTDGTFRYAFRCGSITNDVAVNSSLLLAAAGQLQGSSDMDPGAGVATLTSNGNQDAFTAVYSDISTGTAAHVHPAIPVHPNPTAGPLRIEGNAPASTVDVMDLTGRSVMRARLGSPGTIDLSSLQNGVYVLSIGDGAMRRSARVVVER